MVPQNYYEGVKDIVRTSTNEGKGCKHCDEWFDGERMFEESVNHYIESHNYKLLHVGQETGRNIDDGSPWHSTVAALGK